MPAFDELRNELDNLVEQGHTIDSAFNKLVEDYHENAETMEQFVYLQEDLEKQGHQIVWSLFNFFRANK